MHYFVSILILQSSRRVKMRELVALHFYTYECIVCIFAVNVPRPFLTEALVGLP